MEPSRKLLWKVDALLLPILTISYGLQFYDKAVLGSASVFGVIEDLGLYTATSSGATDTTRYSTATAAFYWGYIVAVLPIAIVLQKLPLAKALAISIFVWGLVVILTIITKNYEGLVVQRFFLGVAESTVSPGFVLLSSMWYRKEELASRVGIWYSATGIFSMFSGVINYGLGSANGPLASWKYMYIFAGSFTMLWAFVVLFIIPDSIQTSGRWFNEEEIKVLSKRIQDQNVGAHDKRVRGSQILESARDPVMYIYFLMGTAIYVCNGAVTAFGARIIKTFGYTSLESILLQIPGGATTCISIYLCGWISSRWKNMITYLLALSCLPPMIGAIIVWRASWSHPGWPLFGYYLIPIFGAPYVMLLALSGANTAGGTKKAVTAGVIFIAYNVGNIIGPYTVLTPEAPVHYRSTFIAVIVSMCFTIVASLGLRFWFIHENKKRDLAESQAAFSTEKDYSNSYLTDKTDPAFRYSL